MEQMRLSRPTGDMPELSEVPVEMGDVVRALERFDLSTDEAQSFMKTERFHKNFRIEGEKLFRIV